MRGPGILQVRKLRHREDKVPVVTPLVNCRVRLNVQSSWLTDHISPVHHPILLDPGNKGTETNRHTHTHMCTPPPPTHLHLLSDGGQKPPETEGPGGLGAEAGNGAPLHPRPILPHTVFFVFIRENLT